MIWVIVALLVIIAGLLVVIALDLEKGLEWLAELIRASGQANMRSLIEMNERLERIERHIARTAKPFYEADEQERNPYL